LAGQSRALPALSKLVNGGLATIAAVTQWLLGVAMKLYSGSDFKRTWLGTKRVRLEEFLLVLLKVGTWAEHMLIGNYKLGC